tara:strand:+ start:1322 stop:2191 length:870 start_codon:yes stop_codon:yes gene_type:complete
MYFDEDVVLDLRMNVLDEHIDYFVIVESTFTHKGDARKLKFNIEKFPNFKDKIIYLVYDNEPKNIKKISNDENETNKSIKYILNAAYRENGQRNFISEGLKRAQPDDLILISDVDEIPNLMNFDFKNFKEKILIFKQDMFYYKFNLRLPNLIWSGTKGCKKKDLLNPQWLRNIKDRKYSFYRLDTFFSKTKYINIKLINNGGWHFSNLKTAKEIEYKLKSYLHHREFDANPISSDKINEIMKNKIAIYDLTLDKRERKFGEGKKLEKCKIDILPKYLNENQTIYKEWLD